MNKKKKITAIVITIIAILILGIVTIFALAGERDSGTETATPIDASAEITTETLVEVTTEETTTEEPTSTTEVTTEDITQETETTEKPKTTDEASPQSSGGSSQTTSSQPTQSQSSAPESAPVVPSTPATTEAPTPKPEPTTQAPVTTEAPKHEHSWYWVVDVAAYVEYVEHPAKYDEIPAAACSTCEEKFTDANTLYAHQDSLDHAGHHSATISILVKEAWTEEIPHEEVGHYECSCGARK